MKLLLIALGGAAGTLARYGTGTLLMRAMEQTRFPLGTLAVNLIGCFLIGYLNGIFAERLVRPEYRLMIVVGVLGGYTTFSSFGYETAAFLRDQQYWRAMLNLLANTVLGIALVMLGYAVSRLHV